MKDILLFREDIKSGIAGWVLALFIVGCVFFGIDYIGGISHNSIGIADGKFHTPAYYQTTYISDGNGHGHTQIIYHPETWAVNLYADGEDHYFPCAEYDYCTIQYGDTVNCTLVTGCITGIVYSGHLK